MKAVFNAQVLAESDETVVVGDNRHVPVASVKHAFLSQPTGRSPHCPWKGEPNDRDITVDGETAANAA